MTTTAATFAKGQTVAFEARVGGRWVAGTGKVMFLINGPHDGRVVGRAGTKRVQFDTARMDGTVRNIREG
jgi:hypothetical protein